MVPASDEVALARAAAGGDGQAFATLYDSYERRIYTFCHRLCGNDEDAADATQDAFLRVLQRLPALETRELNFGAYLFTAARNASYDVIGKRKRADAVDEIPEAGARPVLGDDRGALDEDPERAALTGALQEQVREAHARLPERQREVLVLREVEALSYDEIGEIVGLNRNAVAQLISRARIRLRQELHGTALASVAISSPDCERALPLIAMRQDGQLESAEDVAWLDAHVGGCETCTVAIEAMHDAGISYRALAPVVPVIWLREATMARAAELTGSDWRDLIAEGRPADAGIGAVAGSAGAATEVLAAMPSAAADGATRRRRRIAAAVFGLLLLLLLGVALVTGDDDPPAAAVETVATTAPPAPAVAPAVTTEAETTPRTTKRPRTRTATTEAVVTTTTPAGEVRTETVRRPTRTDEDGGLTGGSNPTVPRTTETAPPVTTAPPVIEPPPATTAEPPPPTTTTPPTATTPPTTTTTPPRCKPGDAACCRQNPNDPNCSGATAPPPPGSRLRD